MPVFVLVAGKRFAGKDTVADALNRLLVKEVRSRDLSMAVLASSFASVAKSEFCAQSGLDYTKMMTDRAYKEQHRHGLLTYAMDRRTQDEDYFVRQLVSRFGDERVDPRDVIIVSDYRFDNERRFLVAMGQRCVTINVRADDSVRAERGWVFTPSIDNSESESGQGLQIDVTVDNNGDIAGLEEQLHRLVVPLLIA